MTRRRTTSVDVARVAGVNQSTVSRTFSDDQSISSETRARVLEVARKLGYKPNAIARSLITQQTNMVGIVMAGINSPFQPYVLEKFIEKLQGMGRQALVFSAGPDQEVDEILPSVFEYRVDALIITSATLSSPRIEECAHYGIPVILFNRYLPGENVSAVSCDNIEGGRLIADLLLDAGHERVAYVAGNQYASTNRDREKGFADRLAERGVTDWLREQAQFNYESGAEAGRRLLQRDDPPDAVFCASDVIALGLIDQARDLGVKIPDQLSVVGFDDIPMAGWSAYSLTTIRQPVNRMIDATLEMVVERIRDPETPPVIKMLPGRLIVRGSARVRSGTT